MIDREGGVTKYFGHVAHQTPTFKYDIMFVSPVVFSGTTLGSQVYQAEMIR